MVPQIAKETIAIVRALYVVEMQGANASVEDRRRLRREQSAPVLAELSPPRCGHSTLPHPIPCQLTITADERPAGLAARQMEGRTEFKTDRLGLRTRVCPIIMSLATEVSVNVKISCAPEPISVQNARSAALARRCIWRRLQNGWPIAESFRHNLLSAVLHEREDVDRASRSGRRSGIEISVRTHAEVGGRI